MSAGEEAPSPGAAAARGGASVSIRFALLLVALLAFLVRLLHVVSWEPWPTGDMSVFVDMALRRLTLENFFSPEGACRHAPGYAAFLKPFLLFLEPARAFLAVRVAQAVLGALTCLLVYRIARRLHSRRAGLAAALLTCFFHHFVFYASAYMSENLFIPLWLAALLAFLRAWDKGGARRLYIAGLLTGAAFLVRPAAFSLAPVALLAALRAAGIPDGRRRLARFAARGLLPLLAGALTLVAPWTLRNWIALGSPVLVAPTSSFNLAVGNTADATGWYMDVETPGAAGGQRDAALRSRVAEFVKGDPWGALYVTLRLKWDAFWAGIPPWPLYDGNPGLLAGRLFFPSISWRLVLVAGLAGLGYLAVRRPILSLLSASCAAAYVGCYLVFFGQPRFRMPLEAVFLAWAGVAVAAAARALRPRAARRIADWPLAVSLLIVVIAMEASASALMARAGEEAPESLIAHGTPLRLPSAGREIRLFGTDPVRLDRSRGRYLRLSLMARRSGPPRATPSNGTLRITFLDKDGEARSWLNTPVLRLDNLPPDRWVPVEIKQLIPPSSTAARVEIIPQPGSPDTLRLDQIALRYARGNDLALEFLFPYLRYAE